MTLHHTCTPARNRNLHLLEALPCRPGGPERSDLFADLEPGPDLGLDRVDSCRIGLATGDLDQTGQERDDVQVGKGLGRIRSSAIMTRSPCKT